MAQENGCEFIEIMSDAVDIDTGDPRPFLSLFLVLGSGEEFLQFAHVADLRLLRAPVQAGGVALLQTAVRLQGREVWLVPAQLFALVEEGCEGGHPRGHRLHREQ
ncbi:hypothetical protein IQ62_43080 [Streptomyces scabiei]|nr:hypothetical protein IQ62_43080 [Streptomyces scabiei]